ncbi:MAG: hypothetical protein PHR61_00425 [Candidatus Absconditabacteria bacterium]|nr:hypothetical protein [Candidatus Absconditabacteria bacterium]
MLPTPKEAAIYIIDTIKEISPIEDHYLDEDIVESIVEDIFYEQLSEILTEEDLKKIEEQSESEEYFREYCQINVSKYYTMLEEIANDLITDYLVEDKEIHEAKLEDTANF